MHKINPTFTCGCGLAILRDTSRLMLHNKVIILSSCLYAVWNSFVQYYKRVLRGTDLKNV